MTIEEVKQGLSEAWDSIADGWSRLRDSAAGALTRFKPTDKSQLPAAADVDDRFFSAANWALLSGNVFEDDKKIIVRLEIPGMDKESLNLELSDDSLIVSGEKRFERENNAGRYRTFQCAYGSFKRVVPLPASVITDKVKANYLNGVLRVEIPKRKQAQSKRFNIKVA